MVNGEERSFGIERPLFVPLVLGMSLVLNLEGIGALFVRMDFARISGRVRVTGKL
jgi:hypothetical protein